jgi:glycosyltransferase involved in cell wall biosynthesis
MRVGIASEWIGEQVGGLERQATDLIRSMVQVDPANEYVIFVTARGARTLASLPGPYGTVRPTALSSRWYYVPVGLPLAVLRSPVDVLHATFTLAPWCPGKRVVFTVHDVCPDVHPEFFPPNIRRRFRWLVRQGVSRATRVAVPSEKTRQELLQHYTVDPGRVVVIPNGVRPKLTAPEERAAVDTTGWPSDYVLYVGRFHARKNLDRLLEAFARVRSRQPVKLVLAGRELWSGDRVSRQIQALGIEKDVFCPGHVTDAALEELYRRARLFAFPSIHEGFGIPPVEAMARGVPVLASRSSAMPEILGDAALYTDPYDVEEMACGIERLLTDDALRQTLVARGYAQAALYDWTQIARRTLSVYQDTVRHAH